MWFCGRVLVVSRPSASLQEGFNSRFALGVLQGHGSVRGSQEFLPLIHGLTLE